MRRKKIRLKYKKERVLLSDVLPYELPFIFTNRYFYRFLVRNEVRVEGGYVKWRADIDKGALEVLAILLGTKANELGAANYKIEKNKNQYHSPIAYSISRLSIENCLLSILRIR